MSADHKPCPVCQDSGQMNHRGYLDCGHCSAATERAALNAYIESIGPMTPYDERWHAYQFALGRRVKTQ